MEKKPPSKEKMADLRKQLEGITGQAIDAGEEQLLRLFFPAGAYAFADGNVCYRSIIFPSKNCSSANLLDATGTSSTGSDGTRTFKLSDFVCFSNPVSLAEPVNIVATPRSTTPAFLTQTHQLINNGADVQITIFAWDATGTAAPGVSFDWRCQVVSNIIIL